MAYEIETVDEGNVDTPLTNFPVGIDTFPRMSDVSITTLPLVIQYNNYYQAGDFTSANQLVEDNPELAYCIFTAKGHNQIRDAVIALEYYLLNQVDTLINNVAANAVGIEDDPTTEQMSIVTYSAEKINTLIEELQTLLLSKINNIDNTADADKSVKYAENAGTAVNAESANVAKTLEDVTVTAKELNYTDGLTSNIQTQLNNKQKTISGAATTITDSNLTVNRALISNGSGKVAASAITSTELGYLDGVTSNLQTQLNNKAASSHNHEGNNIAPYAIEMNTDGTATDHGGYIDFHYGGDSGDYTSRITDTKDSNGYGMLEILGNPLKVIDPENLVLARARNITIQPDALVDGISILETGRVYLQYKDK